MFLHEWHNYYNRNVRMYELRGNAPDFTFEKKFNSRLKVTVPSGMSGSGILLGPYSLMVTKTTAAILT